MELQGFEAIMRALAEAGVRSLLVGGMAVVSHGHGRMTHDLDLVIDLAPDNIHRTFAALNFDSDRFRATPIDIFVEEPFDFAAAFDDAVVADVNGVEVRIVDLQQEWTSDWETARREQMRRFRELPLAETVKAVEDVERLARTLQEAVKKSGA